MDSDKASDSTSSTGEDLDIPATEEPTKNNEIYRLSNEKHTKHWYQDPNSIRIFIVAFLIMSFAVVEFVFGIYTNSLALLADAFHMISDLLSLVIGFFSLMLAKRAKSRRYSYGWIRAEPIGALINGVFLLSLSFYIIIEALQRFVTPPDIQNPVIILIVGATGLGVNLIGLIIFGTSGGGHGHGHSHGHSHGHGHSHKHKKEEEEEEHNDMHIEEISVKKSKRNMNIHGMFLHVLGDALGSIGAMISGVCIWQLPYSWKYYLDPVCSIVISCIILTSTVPLVRTCVYILMQSVPHDVNLEEVEKALAKVYVFLAGKVIKKVEGVVNIHELHIWQLSNDKIIGTVHMACYKKEDFFTVATKMKQVLHSFGVHATTIQPEFVETEQASCVLSCQPDCTAELCCDTNNGLSKRANNKA